MMKAIVHTRYGSPEVLEIKEIEKPIPKDNEILIKIHATTVTAVDSIFRQGKHFFARLATGPVKPKNPILGTELAGEIEKIGRNVTSFKPGDAVFGDTPEQGTYAEYICLPEDAPLHKKPAGMSYEEGAAIPYGTLTALPFLRDTGKIKKGEKILIIGASGSVGSYAVQLARYYEAEITGVCGSANVELVKSLGADHVIDYKKEDFSKSGKTWDVIFDTVGKSSFGKCKKSLSRKGIYMTTVVSGTILLQMLLTSMSNNKKALISFTGLRPKEDRAADLKFIRTLIEQGKIKPVIDKVFHFEQIKEAHEYVDRGHKKGNIVITLN